MLCCVVLCCVRWRCVVRGVPLRQVTRKHTGTHTCRGGTVLSQQDWYMMRPVRPCVVVCGSMLQCDEVCCNVLQCVGESKYCDDRTVTSQGQCGPERLIHTRRMHTRACPSLWCVECGATLFRTPVTKGVFVYVSQNSRCCSRALCALVGS